MSATVLFRSVGTVVALVGVSLLSIGCAKPIDPSGSWTGTVKVPPSAAANRKTETESPAFPLVLLKDHTFTLGPSVATLGGTWKFESDMVTLTITKVGNMDLDEARQSFEKQFRGAAGKTNLNAPDKPIILKLSADGKTMAGSVTGGPGQPEIPASFTKQEN